MHLLLPFSLNLPFYEHKKRPSYVHFNVQTFSGVFEQFSVTSKFLGLKMPKRIFKEKMGLRVFFL